MLLKSKRFWFIGVPSILAIIGQALNGIDWSSPLIYASILSAIGSVITKILDVVKDTENNNQ